MFILNQNKATINESFNLKTQMKIQQINPNLTFNNLSSLPERNQKRKMNIQTDDQCLKKFEDLKFRKVQARYLVYQILQSKIVLERAGAKNQTWQQFVNSLPDKEFRYCVFDLQFKNEDKMSISKMVFVNWSPDTAPIKERMHYALKKENFKKYLDLNTKDITVCSKGDMTEKELIKQIGY